LPFGGPVPWIPEPVLFEMEVFMTFFKEVREDGGEGLERGEMWREKSEAGVQGTREVKGVLT